MRALVPLLIFFAIVVVALTRLKQVLHARGKVTPSHPAGSATGDSQAKAPQGCSQVLQLLGGRGGGGAKPPHLAPNWGKFWPAALILVAGYFVVTHCTIVIPGAHVACIYDPIRGGIQDAVLPEGLHFIPPWVRTAVFSVQTQQYTMSIAKNEGAVQGDDAIKCETNEGLKVALDVSVLFHIDPQRAPQLWRQLGEDYNDVFVRPVARERIRMVVAKYSVQDVYSGRRARLEEEIVQQLQEPFQAQGLVLEQLLLRNVAYVYQDFADAIAAKQARQQQVITEKRNLEKAAYEKQATINQAQGEARSITLRAQTLKANPEVISYDMAQKIGPQTRKAYLSEKTVPLPRGGE